MAHDQEEGPFPTKCDLKHKYNFDIIPGKLKYICLDVREKILVPETMLDNKNQIAEVKYVGVITDLKNDLRACNVQYFHHKIGLQQKLVDFFDNDTPQGVLEVLSKHDLVGKVTSFCESNSTTFSCQNDIAKEIVNLPCADKVLYEILENSLDILTFNYHEIFARILLAMRFAKIPTLDSAIKEEFLSVKEHECFFLSDHIPVFIKHFDYVEGLMKDELPEDDCLLFFFKHELAKALLYFIDDFRTVLFNQKIFDPTENLAVQYLNKFYKLKSLSKTCQECVLISKRTNTYIDLQLLDDCIIQLVAFYSRIERYCDKYIEKFGSLKSFLWTCLEEDEFTDAKIHLSYHQLHSYMIHCTDCDALDNEIKLLKRMLKSFKFDANLSLSEKWLAIFHSLTPDFRLTKIFNMVQYVFSIPGSYNNCKYKRVYSKNSLANVWSVDIDQLKNYLKVIVNQNSSCHEFYKSVAHRKDLLEAVDIIVFRHTYNDNSILQD